MYYLTFIMFAIGALLNISNKLNRRSVNTLLLFFTFWMVFHDGLRWGVGTDWKPYLNYFENCLSSESNFEYGYQFINKLIRKITDNYSVFLVAHAFIVYIIFYSFNKKYSPYPLLSFFILYYLMIGYLGMNRQYIALVLCLLSVPYILKKRFLPFAGLIILAAQFHLSALMFAFTYVLDRQISNKTLLFILFMAFLIAISGVINLLPLEAFMLLGDDIGTRMNSYMDMGTDVASSPLRTVLGVIKRGFWVFILLYYKSRFAKQWPWFDYFFNVQFFALIIYILFSGTILQIMVGRGLLYFSIFDIVVIPLLFSVIKNRANRNALFVFLLLLGLYTMNSSMNFYSKNGIEVFRPYNAIYINPNFDGYE